MLTNLVWRRGKPAGAAPLVTAVSPATGSTFGDATAVITGSGFQVGASVRFDGANTPVGALTTAYLFEGALYVVTPPHGAGPVTVVVTNRDGQSSCFSMDIRTHHQAALTSTANGRAVPGTNWLTSVRVTIHNDIVVAVVCGGVPLAMSLPLPTISGVSSRCSKTGRSS